MKLARGRRRRERGFDLEARFRSAVRRVPPGERRELAGLVRGWRRRRQRVFWVMDGLGDWRRI